MSEVNVSKYFVLQEVWYQMHVLRVMEHIISSALLFGLFSTEYWCKLITLIPFRQLRPALAPGGAGQLLPAAWRQTDVSVPLQQVSGRLLWSLPYLPPGGAHRKNMMRGD